MIKFGAHILGRWVFGLSVHSSGGEVYCGPRVVYFRWRQGPNVPAPAPRQQANMQNIAVRRALAKRRNRR